MGLIRHFVCPTEAENPPSGLLRFLLCELTARSRVVFTWSRKPKAGWSLWTKP